ncbi:VanZ family protein [Streptomyces sp. NPDC026092]|uniref:VanZ family protein n=1 Tax=Streptomyces sp. NPDC026092 TaxID=3154797 RepID=UPI0033EBE0BD
MWQVILYITPLNVIFGLLACLLVCIFGTTLRRKRGAEAGRGAQFLLLFFLGITLLATLTPSQAIGSGDSTVWIIPGQGLLFDYAAMEDMERSMYIRQQVANAAMFLPVAISFRFSFPRSGLTVTVMAACALSLFIEFTQWLMRAGRVVDIDDVLVNVSGASMGALLYALGVWLATHRTGAKETGSRHRRAPRPSWDVSRKER